jgi:glutamine amidotransferase-like uncharacterized protein
MRRGIEFIFIEVALTGCGSHHNGGDILLFTGTGTSRGDVKALEAILDDNQLGYPTANSSELNGMSEAQLGGYRLLIVPGGNFVDMGNRLSSASSANIRNAVYNGLNYLGICAGAFMAGDPPYNGLNLTSGVRFHFYSAENQGIRKTAVPIMAVGVSTLDQYWEDGPELTGWGAAIAKYPDGTPAVAEANVGNGWVVLSGIHPEAPES